MFQDTSSRHISCSGSTIFWTNRIAEFSQHVRKIRSASRRRVKANDPQSKCKNPREGVAPGSPLRHQASNDATRAPPPCDLHPLAASHPSRASAYHARIPST